MCCLREDDAQPFHRAEFLRPAASVGRSCQTLGLKMKTRFIALPMLVLAIGAPALAQSLPAATSAPPLRHVQSTVHRDLGSWDDVFVCSDQDMVLLRRETDLFALSITGSADPSKLITALALAEAQIVACAGSGERLWVFLQSNQRTPLAIDAHSGKMAEFKIAGLKISANLSPEIQSHVIVRHADAVILMIAGGDRETWPRDGNRPLYFWMSLKSGKVVAFPIGWDLEYFSPDQHIAVFEKPQRREFERRPLQAVDVRTSYFVTDIPDRRQVGVAPFDWTDTQPVKPLYARRAETGDRDYFAGISVNGAALPFELGLDGVHYMSVAKANDDFAGFRLRREGAAGVEPSSFWLTSLSRGQKPELVATGVTDFVVLGGGNGVFSSAGHGRKGLSSEAFFRIYKDATLWNVLEAVDRLPALDKEFAEKAYIEDRMSVRLIEAFGGDSRTRLALCLFTHFRGDMRSLALPVQEKPLETTTWRRAVLLTTDGQRYMTDLFRDGNLPDQIWLHNSGRVIMANHLWTSAGSRRERKLQLFETTLRLHENTTGNK